MGSAKADPTGSITIEEQTTDGLSIVVAEITTEVDARVGVRNQDADEDLIRPFEIEVGTYEEYEIELPERLTESAEISVSLYDEGGQGFARDTALVRVDADIELRDQIGPTLIDADPAVGFEYPYFLFAPAVPDSEAPKPLLVQPNNTGQTADELDVHRQRAERDINGWVMELGSRLNAAAIVPVFPRPETEPVDGTHYIHALDRETMRIESGPLERVDLQLLNMVEHAREHLSANEYPVSEAGIMVNGFSASGNFVERFVALHPDEVVSATAGGLNGMVTLPIEEAKGHTLEYHIGVANVEELTGDPFDVDAFRDVPQFLYLGDRDTNDTIPFNDAWTGDFDEIALDVYGEHMQRERFPYCKAVHEGVGTAAVFRMYEDTGHTPRPAMDDVAEFHERVLRGDSTDEIRADLGGNVPNLHAYIEYAPREPAVGEQVAFDATRSSIWDRDIVEYEWEFGSEATETGEFATHTFERVGGHNIRLTVTDETGDVYESTTQIVVQDVTADETESTEESETDTDERTVEEQSGFSIVQALTALGGVGYLLKRRLDDSE